MTFVKGGRKIPKVKKIEVSSLEPEILMGELIGTKVEIIKSTRRELIGTYGDIVDETMNTFTIKCKAGGRENEIVIPKKFCVFRFHRKNEYVDVDGKRLMFRPEDRIKKYWRKFHGRIRRM